MEDIIKKISEHLEFHGYSVEQDPNDDNEWVAKGGSRPQAMIFHAYASAIVFMGAFPQKETFTNEDANFLNKTFLVSRCVIVEGKAVTIEAPFPIAYDKKAFGLFIDKYRAEISAFMEYQAELDSKQEAEKKTTEE
jgi:hypothetical protein